MFKQSAIKYRKYGKRNPRNHCTCICLWAWPSWLLHHLMWVRQYTSRIPVSLLNFHFSTFYVEVVLAECLQDSVHVIIVEVLTSGENEDVDQVNDKKLVQHVPKVVVYEMHNPTAWPNTQKAIPSTEGSLLYDSFPDLHQVISSVEVWLHEDLGRVESFKQLISKWWVVLQFQIAVLFRAW